MRCLEPKASLRELTPTPGLMKRWRAIAAISNKSIPTPTTTNEVPIFLIGRVLAVDLGSHDIMELGKFDLTRALKLVSVGQNELHSFNILSGVNRALINSFHLQPTLVTTFLNGIAQIE